MLYRKKPVVIEAVEFKGISPKDLAITGVTVNEPIFDDKPQWLIKALWSDTISILGNQDLVIKTLEGNMVAKRGDFIIRGVEGEIYACAPSIFEQTYEEVRKYV